MIRMILLLSMLMVLTACTEFAILMSGSSLALTQSTYAKVYNAADMLTIMGTKKSIKGHAYDSAKKSWTKVKEGKEYIYDKTWGLTD
jgi:hypothetical protein